MSDKAGVDLSEYSSPLPKGIPLSKKVEEEEEETKIKLIKNLDDKDEEIQNTLLCNQLLIIFIFQLNVPYPAARPNIKDSGMLSTYDGNMLPVICDLHDEGFFVTS